MLLKVTNFCSAGCSHCMENSTRAGKPMTEETLRRALAMTRRVEAEAYAVGCLPKILLSGGECTEHPDIVRFIEIVIAEGFHPHLISNGMWLGNAELRSAILRPEWKQIAVQVTNDKRFYPKQLPCVVSDPRISYTARLPTGLVPLGRAASHEASDEEPHLKAPTSFNLRSITRSLGSIGAAVAVLRARAGIGLGGNCVPSVTENGDVMAGETRFCFKIGTVDSSNEELTRGLVEMRCNRCGLVDNLTQEQKRAIGESALFSPYEIGGLR